MSAAKPTSGLPIHHSGLGAIAPPPSLGVLNNRLVDGTLNAGAGHRHPAWDDRGNSVTAGQISTLMQPSLNFFELNVLFAPNPFEYLDRRAPRLGCSLLQLADFPLRQADAKTKLVAATAEHDTRQPDLGGKSVSLNPVKLGRVLGALQRMTSHGSDCRGRISQTFFCECPLALVRSAIGLSTRCKKLKIVLRSAWGCAATDWRKATKWKIQRAATHLPA